MGRDVGGIELGGTKTVVVRGRPGNIQDRVEFPTSSPHETLSRAIDILRSWYQEMPLRALGVASFGPIRVSPDAPDFGTMLNTPKPGWRGTNVVRQISDALQLPLSLDTDVNAAALAEHALGAARGCAVAVYLTIGTGLGGGILLDGKPVHGQMHPEIGHVRLRRAPGDTFAGSCSFHGDCAEGLLSGPALQARFGRHPSTVPPGSPEWGAVAHDLAELLAVLLMTLSPQRVVIGGGVSNKQPHLIPAAILQIPEILAGYLGDCTHDELAEVIVPAILGDDAGPNGALHLADTALITRK